MIHSNINFFGANGSDYVGKIVPGNRFSGTWANDQSLHRLLILRDIQASTLMSETGLTNIGYTDGRTFSNAGDRLLGPGYVTGGPDDISGIADTADYQLLLNNQIYTVQVDGSVVQEIPSAGDTTMRADTGETGTFDGVSWNWASVVSAGLLELAFLGPFPTRADFESYALALRLGKNGDGSVGPVLDGTHYWNETEQRFEMAFEAVPSGYLYMTEDPAAPTFQQQLALAIGDGLTYKAGILSVQEQYVVNIAEAVFNAKKIMFEAIDQKLVTSAVAFPLPAFPADANSEPTSIRVLAVADAIFAEANVQYPYLGDASVIGETAVSKDLIYEITLNADGTIEIEQDRQPYPGNFVGHLDANAGAGEILIYKMRDNILGWHIADDSEFNPPPVEAAALTTIATYSQTDLADLATQTWTATQISAAVTMLREENPPKLRGSVHPARATNGNPLINQYNYQEYALESDDDPSLVLGYESGLAKQGIWRKKS